MLAYLFWHRPYATTTVKQYEEALMRFQRRLGEQHPPGFGGSASFRVAALPWLGNRPGYEDWCLLDGSWALDPLNAFAPALVVRDANGQALAYVYCEEAAAKLLTRDEARRIATNIAKLPELLKNRPRELFR